MQNDVSSPREEIDATDQPNNEKEIIGKKFAELAKRIIHYFIENNNEISKISDIGKKVDKGHTSNVKNHLHGYSKKNIASLIDKKVIVEIPDEIPYNYKKSSNKGESTKRFTSGYKLKDDIGYDYFAKIFREIYKPIFESKEERDMKMLASFFRSAFFEKMVLNLEFVKWLCEEHLKLDIPEDSTRYFIICACSTYPNVFYGCMNPPNVFFDEERKGYRGDMLTLSVMSTVMRDQAYNNKPKSIHYARTELAFIGRGLTLKGEKIPISKVWMEFGQLPKSVIRCPSCDSPKL